MRAPWEFSEKPAPEASIPNAPTPEGRALGEQVARIVAIEVAKQDARFPNAPPACNECAGTLGTLPNGCAETLMDLVKCAIEGVPFYCHKGVKEGDPPKALCRAWAALVGGDIGTVVEAARKRAQCERSCMVTAEQLRAARRP